MAQSESQLKLKIREGKALLKKLLAVTVAINNNRKASELYQLFENILSMDLGIEKYAFYRSVDEHWIRVFSNKLSPEEKEINVKEDLLDYQELKALTHNENPRLSNFDFLIPVQHKDKSLAYILLKEKDDDHSFSPIIRNLNFIQTLANIIVVAIENKRLFKEQVKKEREEREMEVASKIQRGLVPNPLPFNTNFEAEAYMQPHHMIGGDYYDIVKTPDGNHVFIIADISGKGTSAALIMSNLQAFFRSTCIYESEIETILQILQANVGGLIMDDKYMTLFIGKYVSNKRQLEYINAGHPSQFLVSKDGASELVSSCSPLGIREDISFKKSTKNIAVNDILFCYTDGLIDIYNEKKEWLSENGLKDILIRSPREESLEKIHAFVLEQSMQFSKRINRDDDVALLSLRFN